MLPPLRLPKFTFLDITGCVEALPHARNIALSLAERDRGLMYLEMSLPLRDMARGLLHGGDPLATFGETTIIPPELFIPGGPGVHASTGERATYQDLYAAFEGHLLDLFGMGIMGRLALKTWREEHGDAVFERFIWPDGIEANIDVFVEAFPNDHLVIDVTNDTTIEEIERLVAVAGEPTNG